LRYGSNLERELIQEPLTPNETKTKGPTQHRLAVMAARMLPIIGSIGEFLGDIDSS